MKLLAFFLLQGLHQKPNNKSYFPRKKIMETPITLDLSVREISIYTHFLYFVDNKKGKRRETRYNRENCRVALCATSFPTLPHGFRLLEAWKGIEVQQVSKQCMKVKL
jgi:hypothetical protein